MADIITHRIDGAGRSNGRVRSIQFNVGHIAAIAFAAPTVIAVPAAANRLPVFPLPIKVQPDRAALLAARYADLEVLAVEDDIVVDAGSRGALNAFLTEQPLLRAPLIMLEDDGSLRAIWRTGQEQVALHFRGDRRVQFVLFVARDNGDVDRAAGLLDVRRIAAQLSAYEADHILRFA